MYGKPNIQFPTSANKQRARAIGAIIAGQIFAGMFIATILVSPFLSLIIVLGGGDLAWAIIAGVVLLTCLLFFDLFVALIVYRAASAIDYKKYFVEVAGDVVKAHVPNGVVEFAQNNIKEVEPLIRYWAREFNEEIPDGVGYQQRLAQKATVLASRAAEKKNLWVVTLKDPPKIAQGGITLHLTPADQAGKRRVVIDVPNIDAFMEATLDELDQRDTVSNNLPPFPLPKVPKSMSPTGWKERYLFPDGRQPLPRAPKSHKKIVSH